MKHYKRMMAASFLCACLFAVGCGGGSQAFQSPQSSQQQTTPTVATGSHVLGASNAKVTIVKFCDFQCPACKSFHADIDSQIIIDYVNTGKAKLAFRHFPLSTIHPNAQIASEAAECAARAGGNDAFWKYHDILFMKGEWTGSGLDASSLKQYAADLQLDTSTFNTCLDNHDAFATVQRDYLEGQTAGVHATPTLVINGKPYSGALAYSNIKAAIDAEP